MPDPLACAWQVEPTAQCKSSEQHAWPSAQTCGHTPSQPSFGFAAVAAEQSGVQIHSLPHREASVPHLVGSFDGQLGSTHTPAASTSKSWPHPALQISPVGQVLFESPGVQGFAPPQWRPQRLSDSPHSLGSTPSAQAWGQQTRSARGLSKYSPLFVPHAWPLLQSASPVQVSPEPHPVQSPPQSTSLSVWSRTPLAQCSATQPGASGCASHSGRQTPAAQASPATQLLVGEQGAP